MNNSNKSEKKFKCNYCDEVFLHRQSKFKHSCKQQPPKKKFYNCPCCEKSSARQDVLKRQSKLQRS